MVDRAGALFQKSFFVLESHPFCELNKRKLEDASGCFPNRHATLNNNKVHTHSKTFKKPRLHYTGLSFGAGAM